MNNQHFPPGIRPVALKAVSEVERARACPHRHASAVQHERARRVERASNAREAEIRFAFPLTGDGDAEAQSLTDTGGIDVGAAGLAGDGTGSASVGTATDLRSSCSVALAFRTEATAAYSPSLIKERAR